MAAHIVGNDFAVQDEISRRMSKILRHKATKYGIPIGVDGFVKVEHLMQARALHGVSLVEIHEIARCSRDKRNELRYEWAERADGSYIRAMRKVCDVQVDFRLIASDRAARRHRALMTGNPPPRALMTSNPPPPSYPPDDVNASHCAPTEMGSTVVPQAVPSAWSLLPPPLDSSAAQAVQGTVYVSAEAPADTVLGMSGNYPGEAVHPPVQRHAQPSQIPGMRHTTSELQGHDVDEPEALAEALQRSCGALPVAPVVAPAGAATSDFDANQGGEQPAPIVDQPPALGHGKVRGDFDGEAWGGENGGYLTLKRGMHITLLPHAESGGGWVFGRFQGSGEGDSQEMGWLPAEFVEICTTIDP